MKIKKNKMEDSNQNHISAFAFDVAQSIEDLISEKVGHTMNENKYFQAKILNWYMQTKDEKFAEYFNIETARNGR